MTVTLMSMVRNATSSKVPYIERYGQQVDALSQYIDLWVVLCEGDSTDDTNSYVNDMPEVDQVLKIDHGGPMYGSVDEPERWKQVAYVYNTALDQLSFGGPLIIVEADIIWQTDTMLALLDDLGEGVDAVAPLSVQYRDYAGGWRNYEIWGHRWPNGDCFPQELDQIISDDGALQPISSAGSCMVLKPEVARQCRWGEEDGVVGFCRDIREKGFGLYLDDKLRVEHP